MSSLGPLSFISSTTNSNLITFSCLETLDLPSWRHLLIGHLLMLLPVVVHFSHLVGKIWCLLTFDFLQCAPEHWCAAKICNCWMVNVIFSHGHSARVEVIKLAPSQTPLYSGLWRHRKGEAVLLGHVASLNRWLHVALGKKLCRLIPSRSDTKHCEILLKHFPPD